GSYYEGNYSLEVSDPPLELIGLYDCFDKFEYNHGEQLSIAFSYPNKSYYFLQAEEKQILRFYRMESKPDTIRDTTHVFGPWSVDDVLNTINVAPSNLSVLVRLNSDISDYFLPATIYKKTKPESLPFYHAWFRLGRNISRGEFRVYKG